MSLFRQTSNFHRILSNVKKLLTWSLLEISEHSVSDVFAKCGEFGIVKKKMEEEKKDGEVAMGNGGVGGARECCIAAAIFSARCIKKKVLVLVGLIREQKTGRTRRSNRSLTWGDGFCVNTLRKWVRGPPSEIKGTLYSVYERYSYEPDVWTFSLNSTKHKSVSKSNANIHHLSTDTDLLNLRGKLSLACLHGFFFFLLNLSLQI